MATVPKMRFVGSKIS